MSHMNNEKRVYRYDPQPFSTHQLLLETVPAQSRVLEVGTASGYLGEYLIHEKGCEVWGIEPVEALYRDALRVGYAKLYHETIEEFTQNHRAEAGTFDVLFLADVLEHMVDPERVLQQLRSLLRPHGTLVISMPNIAHYSIRKALLFGRFDMQDSGILDRTHLHFYTKKTAIHMIERAGYSIQSVRPCSGSHERRLRMMGYPFQYVLRVLPGLFAIQFIYTAHLKP